MSWISEKFSPWAEEKVKNLKDKILVDEETHKQRVDTCLSCEHYSKDMMVCKECWCVVPLKTKVKDFHCPLNKW